MRRKEKEESSSPPEKSLLYGGIPQSQIDTAKMIPKSGIAKGFLPYPRMRRKRPSRRLHGEPTQRARKSRMNRDHFHQHLEE
jgi:hypothetical protein